MLSWIDLSPSSELFREKAARTRKVAEVLDQLFSTYGPQVSWLHFLVIDNNTTVDYVC